MARRVVRGLYEVSPVEGIAFEVNAVSTGFVVAGSMDTTILPVAAGSRIRISPQMMSGAGSSHTVRLRLIFTEESTDAAAYDVMVIDDGGAPLDRVTVPIDPGENLPYQTVLGLSINVVV